MAEDFLSAQTKITRAITTANGATGTSYIAGATLDMAGYEGVLVHVAMGPITSGAETSIMMKQDDASTMATEEDVVGTAQTIADDDDNEAFYIDLKNPEKRYVRLYVYRATQAATVGAATYIQYGARSVPTTHASGVTGEQHVNAVGGTA